MKCLRLLVLLVSACPPAPAAQTRAPHAPLRLTPRILSQTLCAGGAGVDFLHLKLRLRFTNAGAGRLILYKGDNLFFTVWVNPNPDRPSAAQYELKTSSARYYTTGSEDLDRPSPGRDFVVLTPGAEFETDVTVSLPVVREKGGDLNGAVGPGEHLMRVTVSTWYESKSLGEKLRERWRRRGELWLTSVASEPVRFGSDKSGPAERCQATPASNRAT